MDVTQNKWQNKEWECFKEPAIGKAFRLVYTSDQSYKQFMLVIYKSRVKICGIFKSGMTLEL